MSPVVDIRYAYQSAPWDAPLSFGVQAFIEFNGYVINDRHQADRIRVFNITGLDGADIADSREPVPGDHGEFVYDSFYRGRTFVVTGAIEAGSLGTLKRMERDFKAAYGTLAESPMTFRWFDIYDSFDDPSTLQNYTVLIGPQYASSLLVTGGILRCPVAQNILLMRTADNRLWGDVQLTERIIVGSGNDATTVYLVPSLLDTTDYLRVALVNGPTGAGLTIATVIGNTSHVLASQSVGTLVQGKSLWLRARREGDLVTAELWLNPPSDTTLPDFYVSAWLSGSDADMLGDQVLSQVGFGINAATMNWALDDFQVSSLNPCDVSFNARAIAKPSITDSQDSPSRFKRNFQLTMRTGKPYAQCATQSRSLSVTPAEGPSATTELGFSSPISSPLSAEILIPGTIRLENDILSVNNRGTAPDRPIIVIYGAFSNLAVISLTNGQQINWSGSLPDGDYLVFDCMNRTLVNSIGTNMKEFVSFSTPRWLEIMPGWNDLYVTGSGPSSNTKMLVYTRPRFL